MRERRRNSRRSTRGITLIEMLVVLAIIALFASLVAPRLLNKTDTARVTTARAQINAFMTALGPTSWTLACILPPRWDLKHCARSRAT